MTEEHYFTAEPTTRTECHEISFHAFGHEHRLASAGGVFSALRLDPGTAVLLRKAPPPAAGSRGPFLDLGCGYGPIALSLATASQATVYAVDVNQRALELVRANATAAGLADRVVAALPDEVPELAFQEIWSNPPIRVGKTELHAMLDRWLPRLAEGGVAWLVISRNLGGDSVHRWLLDRSWVVTRHASQKGYRVLRVTRPGRG